MNSKHSNELLLGDLDLENIHPSKWMECIILKARKYIMSQQLKITFNERTILVQQFNDMFKKLKNRRVEFIDYSVVQEEEYKIWLRLETLKTKLVFLKKEGVIELQKEIAAAYEDMSSDDDYDDDDENMFAGNKKIFKRNAIDDDSNKNKEEVVDVDKEDVSIKETVDEDSDDDDNDYVDEDDSEDGSFEKATEAYTNFFNDHMIFDVLKDLDMHGLSLFEILVELAYQSKVNVLAMEDVMKLAKENEKQLKMVIKGLNKKIAELTFDDKASTSANIEKKN
ncbi:ORF-36 peptide [Chrysodeixis chalcites nucleopolyhedrovirus]|uniref:ORF-36 peptide n=1 Tax=Chrysodeixis chalcites nucleopolyhedrovirus TaxID=320432 RepID=Q4KT44_9ABAC|nr:ORF-36 peptide [Chrysodeixis chalcites nucleopolyhedrovirus]AAY83967.1 ORF-36 peptide [Chrysodeixis chalcites nucleopolyhedrovirus]AGE61596.1 hypothetical protein [Chrysodeixis chalcites nucleopolyhedrovirus]